MECSLQHLRVRHKVGSVRCEAYSGNAQGERKLPRDSISPKVLRLTQQARDNERELV